MRANLLVFLAITVLIALGIIIPGCSAGIQPTGTDGSATQANAEIENTPVPENVDPVVFEQLKAELIRVLAANGTGKAISTPPKGDDNVITDLVAADDGAGGAILTWTHRCVGDYDHNGEVNISDLTPIGIYYGAKAGEANWALASIADGDGNGEVNISDVSPIGVQFGVTVSGFAIYGSPDIADYPTDANGLYGAGSKVNMALPQFTSGTKDANGRTVFSQVITPHTAGDAYWLCPFDVDGTRGSRSNRALLGQGSASLDIDVHLASINQPTGGSGVDVDPYDVKRLLDYQLQLMHSSEGDVTSHPGVSYAASDANVSIDNTGLMSVGGLADAFSVTGSYQGLSTTMHFLASGPTGQVILGLHPNTPPISGAGTAIDPLVILNTGYYVVQVVDQTDMSDVTLQSTFLTNQPGSIDVQGDGSLSIAVGYNGMVGIGATYNGNPAFPNPLYVNAVSPGNQDPHAEFTINGVTSGPSPLDVEFNASVSYDPDGNIALYEWDFNGNGSIDYSSTDPTASYSYVSMTTFTPELKVTDNDGATAVYAYPTAIEVTNRTIWTEVKVSSRGLNGCVIRNIDGVPNIASTGSDFIDFFRGDDSLGTSFTAYPDIDPDATLGSHLSVDLIQDEGGFECIAFCPFKTDVDPDITRIQFEYATNTIGSSWPANSTPVYSNNHRHDIALWSGNSGINIFFVDEDDYLSVIRTDDGGASWYPAVRLEQSFRVWADFDVLNKLNPSVVYLATDGRLYYRHSEDPNGLLWPGSAHTIYDGHFAKGVAIADEGAYPAIAYVDVTNLANQHTPIYFCRALDYTGTVWAAPKLIIDPGWDTVRKIDLEYIKGYPAVVYQEGNTLVYQRAQNRLGTIWNARSTVDFADTRNPSLCEVDGSPCIAHQVTTDGGITSSGLYYHTLDVVP